MPSKEPRVHVARKKTTQLTSTPLSSQTHPPFTLAHADILSARNDSSLPPSAANPQNPLQTRPSPTSALATHSGVTSELEPQLLQGQNAQNAYAATSSDIPSSFILSTSSNAPPHYEGMGTDVSVGAMGSTQQSYAIPQSSSTQPSVAHQEFSDVITQQRNLHPLQLRPQVLNSLTDELDTEILRLEAGEYSVDFNGDRIFRSALATNIRRGTMRTLKSTDRSDSFASRETRQIFSEISQITPERAQIAGENANFNVTKQIGDSSSLEQATSPTTQSGSRLVFCRIHFASLIGSNATNAGTREFESKRAGIVDFSIRCRSQKFVHQNAQGFHHFLHYFWWRINCSLNERRSQMHENSRGTSFL